MKKLFSYLAVAFVTLSGLPSVAQAHSEQEEPSSIRIVPRRDYLTIQITGAAIDWHDAVSKDPHGSGANQALIGKQESLAAANYARTHLTLEQAGQMLNLKVQKVNWRKLRANDDSSERCEIMLRAERPIGLATEPLNVASDLFTNLEKSSAIIQLGAQAKTVRGAETAEFPASSTFPKLQDDLQSFAVAGALQPLQSIAQLIFLLILLLNLSLTTQGSILRILAITLGCQSAGFLLKLAGLPIPSMLANLTLTTCVVVLGSLAWRTARIGKSGPVVPFAALAGFASGVHFIEPLQLWGLPERGLWLCGLAFVILAATAQLGLSYGLWAILQRCQGKFTTQAQYGGMDWPRVVQIAAIVCAVAGGFYGLQGMG